MLLTRRDPNSAPALQNIQGAMNRLFEEALQDVFGNRYRTSSWAPPAEIFETSSELVLVLEIPGFSRDEVNISFENGQLSFAGERKFTEQEDRNYHRNERWYGRFERTFQLPASVQGDKISAHLKDGLLTVSVPKREEAKARQIEVRID